MKTRTQLNPTNPGPAAAPPRRKDQQPPSGGQPRRPWLLKGPLLPELNGRPDSRQGFAAALLGDRRAYILRRLFATSDLLALLLAGVCAAMVNSLSDRQAVPGSDLVVFLSLVPVWLLLGSLLGLYHLSDRRLDHTLVEELGPVVLVATVWSWVHLLGRIAVAPPGAGVELLPSLTIWASSVVLVLAGRTLIRTFGRRRSWFQQRVALLGTRSDMGKIVRRISRHPEFGLQIVRSLEMEGRRLVRVRSVGEPMLGYAKHLAPDAPGYQDIHCNFVMGPRELSGLATAYGIDRVIIATGVGDMEERTELVGLLTRSNVHVDIVPGSPDTFSPRTEVHYVEGMQILTIPAVDVTQSKAWAAAKRAFDVTASAAAILVLSPLLVYCAVRIKIDRPGPVLFHQERIGFHGRRFKLLKFRTMVAGADDRKGEVSTLNFHDESATAGMFKIAGDPRITGFGGWLRRWSIDELPQLFNVLGGDMSLVGPRPLISKEADLVGGHYLERLRMRPGITGLWQTLGRSDIGFDDMVKLDYTYVTHWSFTGDLRLLLRTVVAVSLGKGAY